MLLKALEMQVKNSLNIAVGNQIAYSKWMHSATWMELSQQTDEVKMTSKVN